MGFGRRLCWWAAPLPQSCLRRARLEAPADNVTQDLYVSADLPQTSRVMVKDEDVCVHCGLCSERCPRAAWDMQKFTLHHPHARDEAGKPVQKEVA